MPASRNAVYAGCFFVGLGTVLAGFWAIAAGQPTLLTAAIFLVPTITIGSVVYWLKPLKTFQQEVA